MTGAGFALPLLAASGAHAADTTTWDKVAQCESAGVWSAASGNGYYGGLQLTQEMWDTYGGAAYASRPDLASRSQQIAVAESILDHRGPEVWSGCADGAGLVKDGRAPEVDPGSTATPSPAPSDDSADPWDSSGTPGGQGSAGQDSGQDSSGAHDETGGSQADPAPSPEPSDSAGSDDGPGSRQPSGSATPGDRDEDPSPSADPSEGGSRPDTTGTPHKAPTQGKHRGDAGDQGAGDDDGRSAGGRHASRGDGARTDPAADGAYTVRPGDTLSAIASAHRLPGGWPALYDRNEGVIGTDADLIKPGQKLDLGHNEG